MLASLVATCTADSPEPFVQLLDITPTVNRKRTCKVLGIEVGQRVGGP